MKYKRFLLTASVVTAMLNVVFLLVRPIGKSISGQFMPSSKIWMAEPTGKHEKHKHVYFLRTHKCGSTTIYSIFLRFGYRNNLTFVLPSKFNSTTIGRFPFQEGIGYLKAPEGENYDILCHHTVYNREGLDAVLPRDTKYIGLVREPLSHFVSAFIYFKYKAKKKYLVGLPGDDVVSSISWYLNNPALAAEVNTEKNIRLWTYTKNGMAYDFGCPVDYIKYNSSVDAYTVNRFIQKLDAEFDLVIVLEYLDESLVFMKRMLNWSLKDILYITYNNRGVINSTYVRNLLTERERENHRKWESVDYALYNHFSQKLLRKIRNEDVSYRLELEDFKEAKYAVGNFCNKNMKGNEKLHHKTRNSNEHIAIDSNDCKMLNTIGRDFLPLLLNRKHYSKFPDYSFDYK